MNALSAFSRRRRSVGAERNHSYYVGLSKRILWALVAAGVLMLAWFAWGENTQGIRLVFSGVQKDVDGAPVMVAPHYQGVDSLDRPFSVTAKTATQLDANMVRLDAPVGDITLDHARWVSVRSNAGLLNIPGKVLDLEGDVAMYYEGGYEMRTQTARVDLRRGTAQGNNAVEGQGPLGVLKANAFEVQEQGSRIIFNGDVRLTIYPASSDKEKKK